MKRDLQRTYKTSLSDDELILLDVMFDCGANGFLLRKEYFGNQWIHPPHQMNNSKLEECLQQLVVNGLYFITGLSNNDRFPGPCYALTPAGGDAWQSERKADWNRYATEQYDETPTGKTTVTILAISPETRDNFWTVGCESGFFNYSNGPVKRATISNTRNSQPIPWRHFPQLHVLVAVLDHWYSKDSSNYDEFDAKRLFWRSAGELMKFW